MQYQAVPAVKPKGSFAQSTGLKVGQAVPTASPVVMSQCILVF